MPYDMEKLYEIILSDGSRLTNLKLNGNNFVSETEVTEDMFEGKLDEIRITDHQGYDQTFTNMQLAFIQYYDMDGMMSGYYFVLSEIPREELRWMALESTMEYLAMMSDIDLTT